MISNSRWGNIIYVRHLKFCCDFLFYTLELRNSLGTVAYVCNPSYLDDGGRRIMV
jgi:hypothetical protein